MLDLFKRFWTEEDGMTTVELVIVVAVLMVVALIFKDGIVKFINQLMNKYFSPPDIEGQRDERVA